MLVVDRIESVSSDETGTRDSSAELTLYTVQSESESKFDQCYCPGVHAQKKLG